MIGAVLLGIGIFIIILLVILKMVGKKEVTRANYSNESLWDKVKDACCTRR